MSTAITAISLTALPVVGIDLVRVEDIEASISRHGDAYLARVYSDCELEYAKRGSPAEMRRRLAARFAAKEATLKILSPQGHWFDWRLIEVLRSPHGQCSIELKGGAAELAAHRAVGALSVSLSHEGELAVAVVMGLRYL